MPTQEQVESHQTEVAAVAALSAVAVRDLFASVEQVGVTSLAVLRLLLMESLPDLLGYYGSAAATVSADWYDEVRASDGVRGRFTARPAELPDVGRTNAMAGWATTPPKWMTDLVAEKSMKLPPALVADIRAGGAVVVPEVPSIPSPLTVAGSGKSASALARALPHLAPAEADHTELPADFSWVERNVVGGMERAVADVARRTVMDSALRDPGSSGWMRVSGGAADCAFCTMLIGRGEVYSAASARFGSHENCDCMAAPAFRGATAVKVDKYRKSARKIGDADRKRVRDWIKANQPSS